MPWFLRRSPLAPAVPLTGSDTVAGLRQIERSMVVDGRLVQAVADVVTSLSWDDLQRQPKSWAEFWQGAMAQKPAYTLPATLDGLLARVKENVRAYLPNYWRCAAAVFLAMFALRPQALLGAAAIAFSLHRSVRLAPLTAAATATEGSEGRAQQPRRATATDAAPGEQATTAVAVMVSSILASQTRCLPIILLGLLASLATVLLHATLRRSPSECRQLGRQPLGFTWQQVLGGQATPLFREVGHATWRWLRFHVRAATHSVRNWLEHKFVRPKW